MKKEALTQGVPVMNESRVKKMVESLDMETYRLSAFVDTVQDIIEDMPADDKDGKFPVLCGIFCSRERTKLDVLIAQISKEIEKSTTLVSELTKEVFKHE